MNDKKKGGLTFNPLLARTEPEPSNTSQPVDLHTRTPVDIPTGEHVDKQTRPRVDTSTSVSKFTFYFTQEQLERLETLWEELRRQRKGTKRQRVSKSQIVRIALDTFLDQFESEPEKMLHLLVVKSEQ